MARGAEEGRLFEGGDYFEYFRQRGTVIRWNTVSYYPLPSGLFSDDLQQLLGALPDCLRCSLQVMRGWVMMPPTQGGGDAPDFKWRGWSNGGRNQNPKKSPCQKLTLKNPIPNFLALKILKSIKWYNMKNINIRSQILCLFIHHTIWRYHESSYCFMYPKKYLPNVLTQTNPRNQKFQTPKNPSIICIPVTWNPEYPPPHVEPPMWVWN